MSIIVAKCPDQGERTDPEALGLAFHHQRPTFHHSQFIAFWVMLVTNSQTGKQTSATKNIISFWIGGNKSFKSVGVDILIYQGVHCCTKVCYLQVLRTVRVMIIPPESSGCWRGQMHLFLCKTVEGGRSKFEKEEFWFFSSVKKRFVQFAYVFFRSASWL